MLSKKTPGTVGSFSATLMVIALPKSTQLAALISVATFVIGVASCSAYLKQNVEDKDPGYIVIDEVCGIFTGCSIIYLYGLTSLAAVLCNFILFRIFDILKPSPIRNVERALKHNDKTAGFGVMLDDVLAAILASAVQILWSFLWVK
jgi:phosphatidylglycerophosphatase A